jgi:hypothetical protein
MAVVILVVALVLGGVFIAGDRWFPEPSWAAPSLTT